jgi:ABC-type antimicrobial peptide transport system permease subunit
VRATTDALSLADPVRRRLSAIHDDLPALDPGTLADRMQAATFVQNVGGTVVSVFGVIALLISTVGLAGVAAQFVAQRRRELAVIVALGAAPRHVARSVIAPPLRLTLLGIVIGTVLSSGAAVLLRNQLVASAAIDVISIAGAGGIVVVTSGLSCLWPMWRAIRLDPVPVIRSQ